MWYIENIHTVGTVAMVKIWDLFFHLKLEIQKVLEF